MPDKASCAKKRCCRHIHDTGDLISANETVELFVREFSNVLQEKLRNRSDFHERYNGSLIGLAAVAADNDLTVEDLFDENGLPFATVGSTNLDQVGEDVAIWNKSRFDARGLEDDQDIPEKIRAKKAFFATALGKIATANRDGSSHSFISDVLRIEKYKPIFAGAVRDTNEGGTTVAVSGLWEVHDQIAAHHLGLALNNPDLFVGDANKENRQELYESIMNDIEWTNQMIGLVYEGSHAEGLDREQTGVIVEILETKYLAATDQQDTDSLPPALFLLVREEILKATSDEPSDRQTDWINSNFSDEIKAHMDTSASQALRDTEGRPFAVHSDGDPDRTGGRGEL